MQIVAVVVMLGLCASAMAMWGEQEYDNDLIMFEQAAPKPCCTPAQWEGAFGEMTGYFEFRRRRPGLALVGGKLSYDSKSKKVAASIRMPKRRPVKLIMDFSQKKRYFIYANGTKCSVSSTKRAFKPACIPSTAKFVGSFYQGAGAAKLNENAWAFGKNDMKKSRSFFRVMASTTKTGCIPIVESVLGKTRRVGFNSRIGFANITPGIKSPAVFTPPKSCRKVDEEDHYFGEEHPVLEYIAEKFHEDIGEYDYDNECEFE